MTSGPGLPPPDPSPLSYVPGAPLPGGYPTTSSVESFEDGVVPFLGDPVASRAMGQLVQICAGALVLFNLARAAMWVYFSSLSNQVVRGAMTRGDAEQLRSVGSLIDTMTLFFWPTIVVMVVVDVVWRNRRRPKAALESHGEAYVEATITRVLPAWVRVLSILFVASAFAVGFVMNPSRALPSEVPGYAMARAASSFLWACAWGMLIVVVVMSERHLERRVAKAHDPVLSQYSVPYVEPEHENAEIGESEGIGWILRTAGLVLAGLISAVIIIGSLAGLPSGKDTVGLLLFLLGGCVVFGLVVWAFGRRFRRRRSKSS